MAHRKGRSVLTGAGIVLGVAILFGVLVSNETTQAGVDNLIEDFTGRADVVVGPVGVFNADLPPGTIDRLRTLPDVRDVVGSYGFGTTLPDHPDDDGEPTGIAVSGIAPDEAQKIQNFDLERGRLPGDGADELVVSRRLADETGLGAGERVTIQGKAESRELAIVGILEPTGAGRTARGHVAYTSIATARALAGEEAGTYDGAAVILTEGTDADGWIDAHREAVPGARLSNADTIAAGFKQFLETFGTFLTFFAGITLFVGAFLIYLTLSMAVIERTRMYGTLRALGATRRQVRRTVLTEAFVLGIVSTLVGLGVGLLLAMGLLTLMASLFDLEMPGLVITSGAVIGAVIVGLAVTTSSALIPALRAGRLAPVEAMKGDYARDTRLGRGWIAGAAILVVSLALQVGTAGEESAVASMSVIGILLGVVLLVPLLLRPLASLLGRLTNRIARGVGDVAVLHLAKERSRSAYTLALVMVVMAMLFASGGLYLSVRAAADEIIERQFGADLFISPQTPQDAGLQEALAARSDLVSVSPLRFGEVSVIHEDKREPYFVRTIEPETYFETASYFWRDGDDISARQALTDGGALLVADEVARALDVGQGGSITLETRDGPRDFQVAAVYIPPPGPPEITISLGDAERYLQVGEPFGYIANVSEGAEPAAVARRLKSDLPGVPLHTETAAELKREAQGQVGTYFQIVYAILAIAAIVGLLGLANTLAMSVLQRFREIGILRAIGVTRSQTWRMVMVESTTMGLAAFVLSFPIGWLLTYLVIRGTSEGFGFTMPTIYPWVWIPFVALFGLVIAVLAAIAPGRRAARLEVVSALQYE